MLPRSTPTLNPAPTSCQAALWLVRHGESTWNALGLCQGQRDEAELTERGLAQAAAVAEGFRGVQVGALYASDLRRALQTAAVVAETVSLPVIRDPRLRERGYGEFEGTALSSVRPSAIGFGDGLLRDPDVRPAGGESVRDLYRRAAAFCDDLARRPPHAPGDVVVVAHGGTLRVLRAYLSDVPVEQMSWEPLENARVLRIDGFTMNARGGTE
jgi:2,3-bisphosphoglycerate-dependent phosphoglycerate mutase